MLEHLYHAAEAQKWPVVRGVRFHVKDVEYNATQIQYFAMNVVKEIRFRRFIIISELDTGFEIIEHLPQIF